MRVVAAEHEAAAMQVDDERRLFRPDLRPVEPCRKGAFGAGDSDRLGSGDLGQAAGIRLQLLEKRLGGGGADIGKGRPRMTRLHALGEDGM